ncbi:DUF4189 domain-containing protein [Mycobacterium sp. pUA109]|uniref:DUF4189 domain-containing protein n=1 Tax=Mycobacterium sp. pUA109 TaxID=3238982 RepID=UPI00351B91A8
MIPAAVGAAAAAMAVVIAPTAYADEDWGAIAVSPDGQAVGVATDKPNQYLADQAATNDCQQNTPSCNVLISFKSPDCGAVVKNGDHYFGDSGATQQEAEQNATNQSPGATVLKSACNGAAPENEGSSTATTPTTATTTTAPAPGG